jgi:hypothetical protein
MTHTTAILVVMKIWALYVEHSLEDPETPIVAFNIGIYDKIEVCM